MGPGEVGLVGRGFSIMEKVGDPGRLDAKMRSVFNAGLAYYQ